MEYFLLDENFQPVNSNEKLKQLIDETYKIIKPKIGPNSKYCHKVVNIEIGTKSKLKLRTNKKDINKFINAERLLVRNKQAQLT